MQKRQLFVGKLNTISDFFTFASQSAELIVKGLFTKNYSNPWDKKSHLLSMKLKLIGIASNDQYCYKAYISLTAKCHCLQRR